MESFKILLAQWPRCNNMSLQEYPFLLFAFFAIAKLRTLQLASAVHPKQTSASLIQFSLVYSKDDPDSTAGPLCCRSRHLASKENLFSHSYHISLPLSTQNTGSNFWNHVLLIGNTTCILHPLQWMSSMAGKEIVSFPLTEPIIWEASQKKKKEPQNFVCSSRDWTWSIGRGRQAFHHWAPNNMN